jgi:hypothetical protein
VGYDVSAEGIACAESEATVSLAEGGAGLGTAWGEQTARRMLEEAGFRSVDVAAAPGPQNSIFMCRK